MTEHTSAGLRRGAVVVLAAVGVLLTGLFTGCGGGVPAQGPPVAVRSLGAGETGADLVPNEALDLPQRGDTALETVKGFFDAGRKPTGSYAAAKAFLRPDLQTSWPPDDAEVQLISSSTGLVEVDETTVRLSATVVGRYSPGTGIYEPASQQVVYDFAVQLTDGVPLITNPPQSVLLDSYFFTTVYQPRDVYFPLADSSGLVADRRWTLPGDQTTQVVRWLLGGPSRWLSPAVRTAVPSGTRIQGLVVRDGVNRVVDLSSEIEGATAADRSSVAAQIALSLEPDLLGGAVRLTVNGKPFPVLENDLQYPERWAAQIAGRDPADQRPYYIDAVGDVRRFALPDVPGESAGEASGDEPALARRALSAGIPVGRRYLAVVTRRTGAAGQELRLGPLNAPGAVRLDGSVIGRPTWALGGTGVLVPVDGSLSWVPAERGGAATTVRLQDMDSSARVVAVRVAPDGARVALVIRSAAGTRAYVGVVTDDGGQVAVVDLRDVLGRSVPSAVDIGWSQQTQLTVLVGGPPSLEPLIRVGVDGISITGGSQWSEQASQPALSLATAPDQIELVDLSGAIYRPGSSAWVSPSEGGRTPGHAPFYPG